MKWNIRCPMHGPLGIQSLHVVCFAEIQRNKKWININEMFGTEFFLLLNFSENQNAMVKKWRSKFFGSHTERERETHKNEYFIDTQ